MKITIDLSKKKVERLTQEAKSDGTTLKKLIEKEVDYEYDRLVDKDEKGTCHSGWYSGHRPKEPNDGVRAICSGCGKGLVKYGYGYDARWQLDKTKKALHLIGVKSN